ncbi:MAG: glycosyltransferase, partial [Planctomycetota bacterium]
AKMPQGTRPRFVTSVHGLHSVSWYSAIVTRGERIEVVSEVARRYVLDHYPRCDPQRIVVNPRGVDPRKFPFGYRPGGAWLDAWREEFPQLEGRFVVTLPGRLTRLKGHHDLLDVIAALPPRFHGLIVGGEDPKRVAYARELRDAVARRGLADRVTFTGHRADIRDVLAASDAAVSLSNKPESFGLAVLESVALGRPTVGYDHGGVGEVLARVYPAGRVPKNDTAAVAQRLTNLDSGDLAPPDDNAVLADFTLEAMLRRSLVLYESLA